VPPGIAHLPGPGEYYASPAFEGLLARTPRSELAGRYPGRLIGTIGAAALPAPNSLVIVIGHTPAQLAGAPGAAKATSIATVSPSSCSGENQCVGVGINASGVDLILSVVAVALLFPVLIFIGTATRLAAAAREQRFAAMRLSGATPRQVSVIAAVESTASAVAGTALGFGLFFLLRDPLAAIPFTGAPFFPGDLSLSLLDVLLVILGIPAGAAIAARLALRRVSISPLGVTRRVTPGPPRAWRVIPLLLGIADLFYYYPDHRPPTNAGQVRAFVPGFVLIVAGLITAGPWLTMAGAKIMARYSSRPSRLIAARRLADNPKASFRAVSGLVLALFVTTVAVAVITTVQAHEPGAISGPATGGTLVDYFSRQESPASLTRLESPNAVVTSLQDISGVTGAALIRSAPAGLTINAAQMRNGWQVGMGPKPGHHFPAGALAQLRNPANLVSCAQLARVPALGSCPAGAQVAAVPVGAMIPGRMQGVTWPAVTISAQRLSTFAVQSVAVATNGSAGAVEQARTTLETAYPYLGQAATLAEYNALDRGTITEYEQLANVVILVSLCIAGCTLAASVAAGLTDRKRPFSLLRLTGAPLALLRRVISLESAVPLLAAAALSIGAGFLAATLFLRTQLSDTLTLPGVAYYVITGSGIVVSLGIIGATFPLLRRMTGAEAARND
jgi:hypothetical protein